MERILIVRLGAMGDVIHALPAVAALRHAWPGARIGWVIEERWADLLAAPDARLADSRSSAKPLVDAIHLADTKAWRAAPFSDETWGEIGATVESMKAARYEAAIDFQGLLKSAMLAKSSGAPMRIGFAEPKERVASMLYTRPVEVTAAHVIEQNLQLVSALGVDGRRSTVDLLPQDPVAEAWCTAELRRRAVGDFVLISPGGGWGAKLWPAERFGEVARALGITALVNFSAGEEELARQVVAASGGAAQAIQCSVGELVALTRRARMFVGGDSGPMHLAAALDIPVVAVFGPTDPARNGPYGTRAIVLRSGESRTSYSHTADPESGMLSISTEQVVAAARQLLESVRG